MTIWALHGFLGLSSDFETLKAHCQQILPGIGWQSVDYLKIRELSPNQSLQEWGAHFNKYVHAKSSSGEPQILLGYSQGGRLGLQALENNAHLWSSAILLSANPGIPDHEKIARLQSDKEWAERFLNESFDKTVAKWNSQEVFQGSLAEPIRQESDFNRRQLADCLIRWSVAEQKNMTDFLKQLSQPMLYVTGERDIKYGQIGARLSKANSRIEWKQISNAGHRVLMDQPKALAEVICQFLQKQNS